MSLKWEVAAILQDLSTITNHVFVEISGIEEWLSNPVSKDFVSHVLTLNSHCERFMVCGFTFNLMVSFFTKINDHIQYIVDLG